MVPQRLDQKLAEARPFLHQLKEHVSQTLAAFADSENFPFSGRIKSAESIAEKIEMGRYARFADIDDLVAFTLVIPTAESERKVIGFCEKTFAVTHIRNKQGTYKSPDVFRFDCTRIIARIPRPLDMSNEGTNSIFDYLFEIQVRTAFEHAWSVATHDLVYKSSSVEWQRIRLAAQLKANSEGLDAAVAAFDHLAKAVTESPWDHVKELSEISEYVNLLFSERRLSGTLKPASVTRFSENFYALTRAIQPKRPVSVYLREVDRGLATTEAIPESLSLYQLFLGILCQRKLIKNVAKLRCHVTQELLALFPETATLTSIFQY